MAMAIDNRIIKELDARSQAFHVETGIVIETRCQARRDGEQCSGLVTDGTDFCDDCQQRDDTHSTFIEQVPDRKERKQRRKRREGEPVRPLNAFLIYCRSVRGTREEKITQKAIGVMWKALSEEEKQPYQTQAEQAKVAYILLKADYDASNPVESVGDVDIKSRKSRKSKKSKKSNGAPKRPLSSFFLYCADGHRTTIREQVISDGLTGRAVTAETQRRLGAQWKSLTEDQKQPYIVQGERAKEEYQRAKAEYDAANPEEVDAIESVESDGDVGSKKRRKSRKSKKSNGGPKRPLSSFFLYCADGHRTTVREQVISEGLTGRAATAETQRRLGAQWKSLTEEEKQPYINQAERAKEEYQRAKAEYDAANPEEVDDVEVQVVVPELPVVKHQEEVEVVPELPLFLRTLIGSQSLEDAKEIQTQCNLSDEQMRLLLKEEEEEEEEEEDEEFDF